MADPQPSPEDVDRLPPTQYLILEVLAARWRLGEVMWTFPSYLRRHVDALTELGLVWSKSGVMPKTLQVWLTDAGQKAATSESYEPPAALASAGRLRDPGDGR